jgi:hypothetical protein
LVQAVLDWEDKFGIAPSITSAISELDAALLVGCTPEEYGRSMRGVSAVRKGYDFKFNGIRYQVKANRPSGKPGSFVTLVGKARNYDWDVLIWILYNRYYEIQEAWSWKMENYKKEFDIISRLSPGHMRRGKQLK